MNENNTNEINTQSTGTTPLVNSEVNSAPVTPEAPSEPVVAEPVAPVTPEAAAESVASEPVAAVTPEVSPDPAPVTNTNPQEPKKNNVVFIVAVVVLLLVIGGLGVYLIFNNGDKKLDDNTTTTQSSEVKGADETTTQPVNTTTQTISTTTRQVTTNPTTTTQVRTTRSVEEPKPTKTNNNSNSVQIYKYNISLPGYEVYEKNGVTSYLNETEEVQLLFNPVMINFEEYFSDENIEQLEKSIQLAGFTIDDVTGGTVGSRDWLILFLDSPSLPEELDYLYMVTKLDSDVTLEINVLYNVLTAKAENILSTLTTALDNKTQAFANGEGKLGVAKDLNKFDILDERLFN